jgi:hypothetical protein
VQPKPGPNYIERMLARGTRYAPQAIRLIGQAMHDPENPITVRLRCAEYIVDKTWPKDPEIVRDHLTGTAGNGERQFTVTFVLPDGRRVEELDAKQQGNGHFSVSFDEDKPR